MLLQKRIHDWSKTLPAWQSDLLRRLAYGPLSETDRADVRAILTEAPGAPTPIRLELADLPIDEDEHGRVELRSLGNFSNINRLAENQTLRLNPGLNVVFGKNATGKTGHGRLLRGVCRAAEREDVLPNVFEPTRASQPQTAEIVIAVDDAEQQIQIDLAKPPDRLLSAISVFDASCARIYLTKPNAVDYVPRPLAILKSLAAEQDAIAADLRSDIAALRAVIPSLPDVSPATAAGAAIASVNARTDVAAVERVASLSAKEIVDLDHLQTAAATIRADKSGELEVAARSRAAGASAAAAAIRNAAGLIELEAIEKIAEACRDLNEITKAERDLADEGFSGSRFSGAGQGPWREMWFAVVGYVEAGGRSFPSTEPGAACPLCEQELSDEASSRLGDLERFVRSDLRQRAEALENELKTVLGSLPDTDALAATVGRELRDAPEEIVAAAELAISTIASRVEHARQADIDKASERTAIGTVDLAVLDGYAAEQTQAAESQASLRDPEMRNETLAKLAELDARKALNEHLPKIKERVASLKQIAVLEDSEAKLGTKAISIRLRMLQEAVITERLRAAIADELEYMSPAAGKIELIGQASKGETVIQLRLAEGCGQKLDRVLSTGEQAALGTAFFLAELAVSEGRSAIVLDDPISSFDHDHREYLAQRLVREAKKRQLVIYTHDLTFLYYLQEAAEHEDVELHGHSLERSLDDVGVVCEGLPTKTMSPRYRRKDLRKRLRFELTPMFKQQDPGYERAADTWVTGLRSGYDQVVEEYVFAGAVRRYHQQVRVKHLYKVKWTLEIAERIHKAWKQASPKSHFEPTELYPRAFTPEELGAMLDEFDAICELTAPRSERDSPAAQTAQATMDEELVVQAQTAGFSQAS